MTYVYAVLDVTPETYAEIRKALEAVDYEHAFHRHKDESEEREVIDMHGIALRAELHPIRGPQ